VKAAMVDIASLLFAHVKVARCKQKTLIKSRLKRLCSRGTYGAVSVEHLMTEFNGSRCRRWSDVAVLVLAGGGVELLCLPDEEVLVRMCCVRSSSDGMLPMGISGGRLGRRLQ
jgi:hypothetical protein